MFSLVKNCNINHGRPLFFAVCHNLQHRNSSSGGKVKNPAQYCLEVVRKTDHEHYLTNLLLPPNLKTDAFAIRAFSSEIAGVRDSVSDPMLGRMRLQFWRDTVENIYGGKVPQHPIAIQLYKIVKQKNPSKQLLLNLIAAREQRINDVPFNSLEDVEKYGELVFGSVYLLLLELMENKNGHIKHALTQLGQCEGLITLLRGVPFNASKRRCLLPIELLTENKIASESIIRCNGKIEQQEITDILELIASRAEQHLENCRFRSKYLSAEEKLLLLPAVAVDQYLTKLSKVKCNVWDKSLHTRNSWLPMSLYWNKLRKKY